MRGEGFLETSARAAVTVVLAAGMLAIGGASAEAAKAPSIEITSPADGSVLNNATPTFSGAWRAGAGASGWW